VFGAVFSNHPNRALAYFGRVSTRSCQQTRYGSKASNEMIDSRLGWWYQLTAQSEYSPPSFANGDNAMAARRADVKKLSVRGGSAGAAAKCAARAAKCAAIAAKCAAIAAERAATAKAAKCAAIAARCAATAAKCAADARSSKNR